MIGFMRRKPFLFEGIIGNSRMLATVGRTGEIHHLFWPSIDYPQQLDETRAGVFLPDQTHETWWIDGNRFRHSQSYVGDSPILRSVATSSDLGIEVETRDFAVPGEDVMVRRFLVRNLGDVETGVRFLYHAAFDLEQSQLFNTTYADLTQNAVVSYRRHTAVAVGSDRPWRAFTCGRQAGGEGGAWRDAADGWLDGHRIELGDTDGCILWDLGTLAPGESERLDVFLAFGGGKDEALCALAAAKSRGGAALEAATASHWDSWLERAVSLATGDEEIDALVRRSLVVIRLMADERHGGILAAPEFDPSIEGSGGYGFCWGRDAAYITTAMDEAGYYEVAEGFYRWAARAQEKDGSWLHRHWVDGSLAPSWGLVQIDETGSIIFGAARHFELTGDKHFLGEIWPVIRRAADYLAGFHDRETGLPAPSVDLWEERTGEFSYSTAAVIAGLEAAARLAREAGDRKPAGEWLEAAARTRAAVNERLYAATEGRFLRGVKVLYATGEYERALVGGLSTPPPVENGWHPPLYGRLAGSADAGVDASLLGLVVPFGVVDARDERMLSTVRAIEERLMNEPAGGVKRYDNDGYRGGNPWVLTTLWLAQYYLEAGEQAKAERLLRWTVERRNALGLLPEQVDKHTGQPAWVVPLTWSHAMFVLTVLRARKAGLFARGEALEQAGEQVREQARDQVRTRLDGDDGLPDSPDAAMPSRRKAGVAAS